MTTDQLPPTTDEPLPGLGDSLSQLGETPLQVQVRRSLRALADMGQVDDRHAGLMQLALELARVVRPGERAYGVAQAAAQLLATFEKLMPSEEGGNPNGFDELRAYLQGVEAARGGP